MRSMHIGFCISAAGSILFVCLSGQSFKCVASFLFASTRRGFGLYLAPDLVGQSDKGLLDVH